jgi:hypothetical protein
MAKLRQIEAYCTDAIPRAEQALHEGKPNIRVNREATFRRSTGDPGYVSVTTSYIEELRNDVTAAHSLLRIYASLIDIKDMTNLSASHRALLNAWADLEPHTVNEAGRFLSRLGALLQQVERHMDQLGTRYTWLLIVVLVWVSIFGVMVPLSLLAARPDSTKLWLASTFGLGLFALPAFLVFQISELRRVGRAELHPEDRPIDIPGD